MSRPRVPDSLRIALLLGAMGFAVSTSAEELARAVSLSDALRIALAQNPNVRLQAQQVTANEGAVLQNRGAFNPELALRLARSLDVRPLDSVERATLVTEGVPNQNFDFARSSATGIALQKT